jgi:hypothetical protein
MLSRELEFAHGLCFFELLAPKCLSCLLLTSSYEEGGSECFAGGRGLRAFDEEISAALEAWSSSL